jgi:hypothetical protein
MGQRQTLQTLLEAIPGVEKVYFQPPASLQMVYPCIRYRLDDIDIRHANNKPYKHENRYEIMVITRDADNSIVDVIKNMATCAFDRSYTADNLYHFVFRLFF